jgi:6-phosphofructokinase 1
MAGKTKMVVSFLNGTFANIPISMAVSKKKQVDTEGVLWTSVLASTGQPKSWL